MEVLGGTASGGGGAGATSQEVVLRVLQTLEAVEVPEVLLEVRVLQGDGGSGVVIIRSSTQAASTTGSPVETTVGSDYVYQFNANGTITSRSKEWRLIFQIAHQTGNSYSSRPNFYI